MTNNEKNINLSRYWLLIGVTALAIAGLFSLVLVVARTPSLASLPLFADLFHKTLVVHVDLSVLVWFLSIVCLTWSRLAADSKPLFPFLEEAALICFALGTLAMTLSPLDPRGQALMSNYIPVITSPLFFLGLSLLFCGTGLMVIRSIRHIAPRKYYMDGSACIAVCALIVFMWSYYKMPSENNGQPYYELLFWGGGHVLQFLYTQQLLLCWMLLINPLKPDFQIPPKTLFFLLSIGFFAALLAFIPSIFYDIDSSEYRIFFTHLMIMANGIAPFILMLFITPVLWRKRQERKGTNRALWSSLAASVSLFLYGGFLGILIEGQNVVIPAHYHGSIVGVTLAFMGTAYLLLPHFGYRDVSNWRLAYWQPIIYGIGQLMHISGLAWSGGYGVLRKTPGGLADVSMSIKAAMGFMGLGGLIAIIGGFMFVIVIARAVLKK